MFKVLTPVVGFAAVSGSTLAYYFQQLKSKNSRADCKPYQHFDGLDSQNLAPWNDNWDYRDPNSQTSVSVDEKERKKAPTATRHVILVRHGQYVQSKEEQLKVLTELGKEQASLTGDRLKALSIEFDRMIISTVIRAQETGKIVGDSIPNVPQEHCSLLEEGSPYPVVPSRAELETYKWKLLTFADHPRIEGAFRKYIHRADPDQEKDSYDLLVCHGNVIRYFVCRALQFPPEGWLRMSIANCGITWITIRPTGGVSLRGLGDVGHLPSNLITYN